VPAAAQWRTGYFIQAEAANQTAATIPWSKYTHIIHSALRPTYTNGICGLDSNSGLLSATNITDFVNAAHASDVKAIVGIREDNTQDAIAACTAPQNIAQFVELIRTFVANYGYDGVDLNWESRVIAPQYQDLIRRLRALMATAVLSVAVGGADGSLTAAIQYDLDQINIRAFDLDSRDLAGGALDHTWYHAPTFQGASIQDQAMDTLFWSFVRAGNASGKLGLVVPFYGRIRKGCLDDTGRNGVTEPNQAWIAGGEIAYLPYRDLVNSTYWSLGTHIWDDSRKSQYIQYRAGGCASDAFVSYVGSEQLQEIVALIAVNKLGGIATFGLPYEYLPTLADSDQYPLSAAIYSAMISLLDGDARLGTRVKAQLVSRRAQAATSTSSPTGDSFTYYVDSANGLDSNPGTFAKPWKTVAKVNSTKLAPGQSVGFARGGVWRETLTPGQSGIAGSPITFGAYGSGALPIINASDIVSTFVADPTANVWDAPVAVQPHAVWIDGASLGVPVTSKAALTNHKWFWSSRTLYVYGPTNPSSGHIVEAARRDQAIFVNQANYITLNSLEATNANNESIYLRNCTNASLQSVKAHDSVNQAIIIWIGGGSHTISNSELYNTGLNGSFGTGSGIQINNTTKPSLMEYTYIHNIGPFAGDHAVYDESGGNTYRYNHFKTPLGVGMKIDASNTTVAYNIFDTIPSGGILIDAMSNVRVYNNTFYQCGTMSPYAAIWFNGDGLQSGVDIRNNIAYVASGYALGFLVTPYSAGWASDYNDVLVSFWGTWKGLTNLRSSTWQSTTGLDRHTLNSDPLFTNAGAGDFTLKPGSSAIGAGVYIPGVSTSNPPNIGAR
jgi:hypothetical protein